MAGKLSYYEKERAAVRVGIELEKRGWTLFGYSPDQSDSMRDYYHPAHWSGVATHDAYPGVTVNVHVHSAAKSGKPEIRHERVPGATCPTCNGSGIAAGELSYAEAKANPREAHYIKRDRASGLDYVMVSAFGGGITIDRRYFHDDGQPCCLDCLGKGHQWENQEHVEFTWPTFHITPKGKMWSVTHGDRTVATGTGFDKCSGWNGYEYAVSAVADEIEAAASRVTRSSSAGDSSSNDDLAETTATRDGVTVSVEYSSLHGSTWSWISIQPKVGRDEYQPLKDRFALKWSKRRFKVYATRRIEAQELLDFLRPAPQVPSRTIAAINFPQELKQYLRQHGTQHGTQAEADPTRQIIDEEPLPDSLQPHWPQPVVAPAPLAQEPAPEPEAPAVEATQDEPESTEAPAPAPEVAEEPIEADTPQRDGPRWLEESFSSQHWGNEAQKARNRRAKELRSVGWSVDVRSYSVMGTNFAGLIAKAPGFTGPIIQSYDSRTGKSSTRYMTPENYDARYIPASETETDPAPAPEPATVEAQAEPQADPEPFAAEVEAAIANATRFGGTWLKTLVEAYYTAGQNDPGTSRSLLDLGQSIVPGVRAQDAIETAVWASEGSEEEFRRYVRRLYAENRVRKPNDAPTPAFILARTRKFSESYLEGDATVVGTAGDFTIIQTTAQNVAWYINRLQSGRALGVHDIYGSQAEAESAATIITQREQPQPAPAPVEADPAPVEQPAEAPAPAPVEVAPEPAAPEPAPAPAPQPKKNSKKASAAPPAGAVQLSLF